MKTILALDLGTKTGYALRNGEKIIGGTQKFTPAKKDGYGVRFLKFKYWLTDLKASAGGIDAIYYEDVKAHNGTQAAHCYGAFLGVLTAWAEHHQIPYEGIGVGTIKKSATGKGNSDKNAVIDAMRKKGYDPVDDNHADALALMEYVQKKD